MRRSHDISSTKLIGQGSAKCLSSFFCKQHFMRIGKYTTVPGILVRYVSLGAPALIKASKQGHGDGGQQWQVQHSSTENAANKGLKQAESGSEPRRPRAQPRRPRVYLQKAAVAVCAEFEMLFSLPSLSSPCFIVGTENTRANFRRIGHCS